VPNVDVDTLRARVEALVEQGEAIPHLPPEKQPYMGAPTWVDVRAYIAWRARATALLRGALPANHTYVTGFEDATRYEEPDPDQQHVDGGLGVLGALAADLADGQLTGLRSLISGEIFTDFMAMAAHLLDEKYPHAAASIAGAVLEDSLRTTLRERGEKATGNLESMNQVALDTQLYGGPVYQQVKVWIGVRNDADHGQWETVTRARVEPMVRDLPGFLASQLGLA
jgi:hypothetical protein